MNKSLSEYREVVDCWFDCPSKKGINLFHLFVKFVLLNSERIKCSFSQLNNYIGLVPDFFKSPDHTHFFGLCVGQCQLA